MTPPTTREAILDAALDAMTTFGIARLSLRDVANRAGVSRQTVYRYFTTKDEVVAAVILREEEALLELVRAAGQPHADLRSALGAALNGVLQAASEHPLLQRLLDTEPERLLPFLMSDQAPVLSAATPALTELLLERVPDLGDARARRAADALTRLVVSWVVNPPADRPEVLAADAAAAFSAGLVAGGAPAPTARESSQATV